MKFLLFTIFLFSFSLISEHAIAQTSPAAGASVTQTEPEPEITAPLTTNNTVKSSEYLDVVTKFTDMFTTYAKAFATLIVFFIMGLSVFIARSRTEIVNSLQEGAQRFQDETSRLVQSEQLTREREFSDFKDSLPLLVEKSIRNEEGKLKPQIEEMRKAYQDYSTELENYKNFLEAAEHAVKGTYANDPIMNQAFADYVSRLPEDPNSADYLAKRHEARERLTGTLTAAERGDVDANLLFNSSMVASRLDMDDIALKLMTYAEYFSPAASHRIALYRLQMTLGRAYAPKQEGKTEKSGKKVYHYVLDVVPKTPKEIEQEAFTSALKAAANAPLPQNEIIYAELWNMAQKTRETGGYERMRDVLFASYSARQGQKVGDDDFEYDIDKKEMMSDPDIWKSQKDLPIPSNLPGKISATYALIGTPGWEEKYSHFLSQAEDIAAQESPMTTWRKSFIRDALSTANHLGIRDETKAKFKSKGLITEEMEREQELLSQIEGGNIAQLLQAIAQN